MIKVLLADDHQIVRLGLRAVLETEDDIEVVGEVATADEAVRAVTDAAADPGTAVDVVLMDLRFGAGRRGGGERGAGHGEDPGAAGPAERARRDELRHRRGHSGGH